MNNSNKRISHFCKVLSKEAAIDIQQLWQSNIRYFCKITITDFGNISILVLHYNVRTRKRKKEKEKKYIF